MSSAIMLVMQLACARTYDAPPPAPTLEQQCDALARIVETHRMPLPPASAVHVSSYDWSSCREARDSVELLVLTDFDLQIERKGLVDALGTCAEQLYRQEARWNLLAEADPSPQRDAEEKLQLENIANITATLPLAMEPHLIALDERCRSQRFAPRVEVMKPQVDP